ncbi:hypothetical protein GFL43_34935 [Rhizobium laguerreae]|nr:hypothetical protein [Rhizobium laguerreae]
MLLIRRNDIESLYARQQPKSCRANKLPAPSKALSCLTEFSFSEGIARQFPQRAPRSGVGSPSARRNDRQDVGCGDPPQSGDQPYICNTPPFVTVDDIGARHANRNLDTTQIGGEHFTAFRTTPSKSRLPATLAQAPAYRESGMSRVRRAYAFYGCSLQM